MLDNESDDESEESCLLWSQRFFFVSNFLLLNVLQFLSMEKSDSLDDESVKGGSYSGSAGTCAFFCFFEEFVDCADDSVDPVEDSVGRDCGVGSEIFVLIVIESISEVIPLIVFVTIGVDSKGGQLIEIFWRPKS